MYIGYGSAFGEKQSRPTSRVHLDPDHDRDENNKSVDRVGLFPFDLERNHGVVRQLDLRRRRPVLALQTERATRLVRFQIGEYLSRDSTRSC